MLETEAPGPQPLPGDEPLRLLLPTPIGSLGVSLRGNLVTGIVFDPPDDGTCLYVPFNETPSSDFLEDLLGQFSEYFAGARANLTLEYDLQECALTSFARRVFREATKVPFGRTRTYNRIGELAGKPEAYRQVLSILMTNPIPLLIPCHRIVTHKSGIGSFVGGRERKRWLLTMEKEAARSGVR
jgi:methylated-DNA-[protein]-cysteine S-methyltransferase